MSKVVPNEKDQLENESRALWKDLTKAILEDNLEMAQESKDKVETKARNGKKEIEEKGEEYKQKFFAPSKEGGWNFIGNDSSDYKFLLDETNFKEN
jgi:hypothetical protein